MWNQHKFIQLSLLTALSTILFSVESLIPMPLPWMRLGLANMIILIALKAWGLKESLLILVLRVFLGSLLIGRLFSPSFIISLSGGLSATILMGVMMEWEGKTFSFIGISSAGALLKNVTQLGISYFFFVKHAFLFKLLPLFMISSLFAGLLIGLFAVLLWPKLNFTKSMPMNTSI